MTSALLLAASLAAQPVPAWNGTPEPDPMPSPRDWPFALLSSDDYPAAALRGNDQGTVRYRIEIGPEGRVTGCTVIGSSGSAALDQATCRIVRARARFTPARDSQGNAVPDAREGEVTWRLPRDD